MNRHKLLAIDKHGFTLIELLVVIAIFVLIANVTMISLNNAKREARDTKRMSNINQLRSALHLYSTDNSTYPVGDGISLGTGDNLILDDTGWVGANPTSPIFMYSIPRDPRMLNDTTPGGVPCTGSSTSVCDYSYTLNGDDYYIYFFLEDTVGSYGSGIHYATKDELI